jgi:ABC-2 type transport system permease protein
MAELAEIEVQTPVSSGGSKTMQYMRAFAGLFLRDLHVLRRELFPFVVRVCMNPLLFLFVFTFIMPHMSGGARWQLQHGSAAGAYGGRHHVQRNRRSGIAACAGVRRYA